MSIDGDVAHVQRNLVGTLSKSLTIQMLKEWRDESESKDEATILTDVLGIIMSGELDG